MTNKQSGSPPSRMITSPRVTATIADSSHSRAIDAASRCWNSGDAAISACFLATAAESAASGSSIEAGTIAYLIAGRAAAAAAGKARTAVQRLNAEPTASYCSDFVIYRHR